MDVLRIAVSKGSLLAPTKEVLEAAGLDVSSFSGAGRSLFLAGPDNIEFIIARASDVPTYVEWGAADLGFVGSDVLMEGEYKLCELLDLGFGRCKFVLAGPVDARLAENLSRPITIATKYPNVAAAYLARRGLQAEIIKLYGSMELAPLVGLSDQIIDLMSSGRTLSENGLAVVDEIASVSCRLVANYISYKLKSVRINDLVERLADAGFGSVEQTERVN